MVNRLLKLSESRSFFLFGARGVGKSTLLKEWIKSNGNTVFINLLDPRVEDRFRVNPGDLSQIVINEKPDWIVIDEVQKLPKLLDLVHLHIEEHKQKFALSGSSARKLKRGSANMLAGRASLLNLYPFSSTELGEKFDLEESISWGGLPEIYNLKTLDERKDYLESYAILYLKEEIQAEQLVRQLDPFRNFLPIAAQMSGQPINFSKIGRDVGVDTTTVQNYFSILEDTLIGFSLPAYHSSIRKRQRQAPKFYFFDIGVIRALTKSLDVKINKSTSVYGLYFEHFIIQEIRKLADYKKIRWNYSYLQTKDGVEVDLVLDHPNKKTILIEVKSTENLQKDQLGSYIKIAKEFKDAEAYCFSNDLMTKNFDGVTCLHWQKGLEKLGLLDE